MSLLVGADTGGTFTDLIAVDSSRGQLVRYKLASTPQDPARAVLEGLARLQEAAGTQATSLAHGTTVATNAVLTGSFARTALITTAGFRDICELARQRRPHLYDPDALKPSQISPRNLRFEVSERMTPSGEVIHPLDPAEVRELGRRLRQLDVEAVAIVFLHAYANPRHEQVAEEELGRVLPEVPICTSSGINPELREFERTTTTNVNAALLPVIDGYLGNLEAELRHPFRIMQSNGGVASGPSARQRPINTLLSGPAAGVLGALACARQLGAEDFVSFDMGGTSTDVCLVQGGVPGTRTELEVAGLPVRVASLDVHTVGAGGGSVAWLDGGGFLRVGPQSAGADPGPACYDRGGTEATVSDAGLVVGHLSPAGLLGGRMPLRRDLSEAVLQRLRWIDLDPGATAEERAAAVLRIATSHMVEAVRLVTVGRGIDPRGLALFAYGGAGPVHAAAVARELSIRRVIVPPEPGLLCASGLIAAEPRADFALSAPTRIAPGCESRLQEVLSELTRRALSSESGDGNRGIFELRVDVRYIGQSHPLVVEVPAGSLSAEELRRRFEERHLSAYGYLAHGEPAEVLTVRLTVRWPVEPSPPAHLPAGTGDPRGALQQRRVVVWGRDPERTPVYDRTLLRARDRIRGPAVIEQMDSTVLIPPTAECEVHDCGALLMEVER